jgi:hypothetical protein
MASTGNKKRGSARRGKNVGRYVDPASSGRVTAKHVPTRAEQLEHTPWFARLTFGLGGLGTAMIVLNYLKALPGATSPWYLLIGLISIFSAFFFATKIR